MPYGVKAGREEYAEGRVEKLDIIADVKEQEIVSVDTFRRH
jgi:hypothetical protein